ncbi:MAG: DUF1801 domain-containing protein [Meiothermus sp.]|nr:DUF1801 domain-containing protein [Meiothermus sp.]
MPKPPTGPVRDEVEVYLETLEHPLKAEAMAIREVIAKADPSVVEGIKWNTLSFRTSEWFATFHLRKRDRIGVILHLGAKRREVVGLEIPDPDGLLEWLAPDRAQVMFGSLVEIQAKGAALTRVIQSWIKFVE